PYYLYSILILFTPPTPPTSTLFPLHDALPICRPSPRRSPRSPPSPSARRGTAERHRRAGARRRPRLGPHDARRRRPPPRSAAAPDRKSTRLNSSHLGISYAVFCLKKKIKKNYH